MQKTMTRLDVFVANVHALGFGGTKQEWDDVTSLIRTAIRVGLGPQTEVEAILFTVVNEIWGDLL